MRFYLKIYSAFILWFAAIIIILSGHIYVDQEDVISNSITQDNGLITYEDTTWKIDYESNKLSTYEGKIRHASKNNEKSAPMMTHDILVTSGDFEDEDRIKTSVYDHHFTYRYYTEPEGTINLIHAVPEDINIYHKLNQIRYGDRVRIQGYEISRITNLDNKLYWRDKGCNTLYITEVEFINS